MGDCNVTALLIHCILRYSMTDSNVISMCLAIQTITAAESRAGVHHFDCWNKKLEQMKTRKMTEVDKKKKHFPKHCKSQARKQMTL